MAAQQEISNKYNALKLAGTDLGNPISEVESSGSGGFVRKYQFGHIYWHANTGAHEVHGGILEAFLRYGGVGKHPVYGKRLLGYPVSDEKAMNDKAGRVSYFEWGAIYWNTSKNVRGNAVWGACFTHYKAMGESSYPATSTIITPIGEITYFETSCLWKPQSPEFINVFQISLNFPQLGRPMITVPKLADSEEFPKFPMVICGLRATEKSLLEELYPDFIQTICNHRIGLRPVITNVRNTIPLTFTHLQTIAEVNARVRMLRTRLGHDIGIDISAGGILDDFDGGLPPANPNPIVYYVATPANFADIQLSNNILYDLVIKGDNDLWLTSSAHCFYAKSSWDNFAAIHATDLHVSRRLDSFRKILHDKNKTEGVNNFINFNDSFRDLIIYANKLHRKGVLDMLILTGDLVDYIFENGDDRNGPGNFSFFKKMILGQSPFPDKEIYPPNASKNHEELQIPVFTTLGNHDYRPNAYDLIARIDAGDYGGYDLIPGGWKDEIVNQFGSMNLTPDEARAILGRDHVYYSMNTAASKVEAVSTISLYQYHGMINQVDNYVVNLGKNKLVMINTESDYGIIGASAEDSLKYIFGFLNESEENFVDSNPDSVGLNDEKLGMLKRSLEQTPDGVVIVGMHAPPLNPKNNEMPHFLRETEHPEVNKELIGGYLNRCDYMGFSIQGGHNDHTKPYPDWLRSNSRNFKRKSPGDFLDYGVSKGKQEEFLKLCNGRSGTRKVDLVLSGHGHKRVEYRLGWSDTDNHLRYYMDFYTENPSEYYKTKYNKKITPITYGHGVFYKVTETEEVRIYPKDSAAVNAPITRIVDHRDDFVPWQSIQSLSVPTYPNPLIDATSPENWWNQHRPIIVQTAALGPIEANNRKDASVNPKRPGPAFRGFRYIKINNNVISKMHYVTMAELYSNNFRMPWEPNSVDVVRDLSVGEVRDSRL